MNQTHLKRNCPACNSESNTFFAEKNGFNILKCAMCGTLFVSNPPADTADIYGNNYFWGAAEGFGYVDYDTDKAPMKKVFEDCVKQISEMNTGRTGKLLDIGAATGYFMTLAEKLGWKSEGVEIGKEAAEAGRKKGLKMTTGTIHDLKSPEKFDAVTMFDVVEHMKDTRSDLKKARALLKEGGSLVIITPDAGSFYARLLKKRWHLLVPPEHLSYFTRRGLTQLLNETGFDVVQMKAPGKSFTLEYILHTLLRWQKLRFWKVLLNLVNKFPRLAKVRLPVNFGDNMLVFAKTKSDL